MTIRSVSDCKNFSRRRFFVVTMTMSSTLVLVVSVVKAAISKLFSNHATVVGLKWFLSIDYKRAMFDLRASALASYV